MRTRQSKRSERFGGRGLFMLSLLLGVVVYTGGRALCKPFFIIVIIEENVFLVNRCKHKHTHTRLTVQLGNKRHLLFYIKLVINTMHIT